MITTLTASRSNINRYTPHPGGYQAAVSLGEDYARQARLEVDTDEPTIDCLQSLLLLALAFVASGKGKKAYMLLCTSASPIRDLAITDYCQQMPSEWLWHSSYIGKWTQMYQFHQ